MQKIQLLAPAGSIDILRTAVHAGADDIYIGGPAFSARAGAKNFTIDEMREGIEYAHFFNRKLFVAVNTLIKDDEIKQFLEYLEQLARLAPDALIVQDLGVAKLVKDYAPELPLHASTQLTASNQYSIKELKKVGFNRVVVARELSLEEISKLCVANPDIEIEAFIHGAQCFCYSGQCLMSSMIGGRSGNRGQCAQPCRLQYQLLDEEGTLISPKDLFGLPLIRQAIAAGINTLKIEGRLKNRDYVYKVVTSYRELIDSIYNIDENVEGEFSNQLESLTTKVSQTFNREFSSGFLKGNLGQEWISRSRHNSKGTLIGRVEKYDFKNKTVIVSIDKPLVIGDGIYIESKGSEGVGFSVNEIVVNDTIVAEAFGGQLIKLKLNTRQADAVVITKGSSVYKSFDINLSREIIEKDQAEKVGISFKVIAKFDQPVSLEYCDADDNCGQISYDYIVEKAERHPITHEVIQKQLSRLGNTLFYLDAIEVDLATDIAVIIPVSVLNELRRLAVEECTAKRLYRDPLRTNNLKPIIDCYCADKVNEDDSRDNITGFQPALVAKIHTPELITNLPKYYGMVYYAGDWNDLKEVMQSIDKKERNITVFAVMPAMIKEREVDTIVNAIKLALAAGVKGFVVNQIGQRELILTIEPNADIIFDSSLHAFNSVSYEVLQSFQPIAINLSLELNRHQLKQFSNRGYVYIHSRYRLMISEHSLISVNSSKNIFSAPIKGNLCSQVQYLKDRKGYMMPCIENEYGQVEIYNAQITNLMKELEELMRHNHQGYIVDVSRDFLPVSILEKTLSQYAKAYLYKKNQSLPKEYQDNLTKGHWQRGVK
jgi:putative protease